MYKKLVSYFLEKYSLKNKNLNNTKIKQYSIYCTYAYIMVAIAIL